MPSEPVVHLSTVYNFLSRRMSSMASKRGQPRWEPSVENHTRSKLKLFNSLTRSKEVFQARNENQVTWYNCGPTVYDASHMGHARTYLSFDILRRVMRDYFGYNIFYVMNITDIDDKIIRRARQEYLVEKYLSSSVEVEQVKKDCYSALQYFLKLRSKLDDGDDKVKMYGAQVDRLQSVLDGSLNLELCKDLLGEWLDQEHGVEVSDNSIFESLPRKWEQSFHDDMTSLNVLPADRLCRVSEHIAENVAFIEKLVKNQTAYESNGSVYFDVNAFDADSNHFYAKLVPEAAFASDSVPLLADGEGALHAPNESEKRSAKDFALWKRSKAGEPSWSSPWGLGRPGWHVECSAMASHILGPCMDIHSGGIDLKFPHHDNELAQSEAYHNQSPWVNYFLHSGHLHIDGCKMSKSLKNFVSISDVLTEYTARHIRWLFLLHGWRETLDYSHATMELAVSVDKTFQEFFLTVQDLVRHHSQDMSQNKWTEDDVRLKSKLEDTKSQVHEALADSIDTRTACELMRQLVAHCYLYLKSDPVNVRLVADIAKQEIRQSARQVGANEVLTVCDSLRDNVLPELGVRLEDKECGTTIKLVGRDELMRERQMKLAADERKAEEKRKKAEEVARRQAEVEAAKHIDPRQMFELGEYKDKFSKYDDETGLPTHDLAGDPISKGLAKKLAKLQIGQQKRFDSRND